MTVKKSLMALATTTLLAACGPAQAVITLEIENEDPTTGNTATLALEDVEVRLFPFDRDAIFSELEAAAATPEPAIPDSVAAAQTAVRAAQEEWQGIQQRWNVLRDTLQTLSAALGEVSRASGQYRVMFNDFNALDDEYSGLERQLDRAFKDFTDLQEASIAAADEVRLLRDRWADEAFAEVGTRLADAEAASGRKVLYDTTGASGIAEFEANPGQWWVTARWELPFEELYWNVPFDLTKDAPAQVRLTLANAQRRPKL
jgi:hypothetical protein